MSNASGFSKLFTEALRELSELICASVKGHLLFKAEIIRVKLFIDTSESFYLRLILLVGVLVTLCISEGVGLQLLPIPSATDTPVCLEKAKLIEVRTDVPSPSPRSKSVSGRVEIMAPKIDRLSRQQSIQIDVAALPTIVYSDVSFPCAVSTLEEPTFAYSIILVSQSADRAPPSLA
jgi:hypothetical protein